MKDRSVEYPNRYRMTLVPGTTDIYEMTPAPGEVYEEGTLMSKANILDDNSEIDIWGTIGDRTPNDAFSFIGKILLAHDEDIANLAETLEGKIVTGTYTGNGAASRTISLGFTPKAVLLSPKSLYGDSVYSTSGNRAKVLFAVSGSDAQYSVYYTAKTALGIVTNGFSVHYASGGSDVKDYIKTNDSGAIFNYIAIA